MKDTILDLDNQENRELVPALMYLTNYDHPQLINNVLKLLVRQFRQREELLETLDQVQLLVTQDVSWNQSII